VTAVSLDGVDGRTVARQGRGDVALRVTGRNLDGAKVSVDGVPLMAVMTRPTAITVTWSIPHGAPIGPRSILVETPFGQATAEGAIAVSPITVRAGASDGEGTPAEPFGDLVLALGAAAAGDEVHLTGEFPLDRGITIGEGVRVLGAGEGVGTSLAFEGNVAEAVTLAGGARLERVAVTGGKTCVAIAGAGAVVSNLVGRCANRGIVVKPRASATVELVDLMGQAEFAISAEGDALTLRDSSLSRSGYVGLRVKSGLLTLSLVAFASASALSGPFILDERAPLSAIPTEVVLDTVSFDGLALLPGEYVGPGRFGADALWIQNATKVAVK
jgi:hypothetical protein